MQKRFPQMFFTLKEPYRTVCFGAVLFLSLFLCRSRAGAAVIDFDCPEDPSPCPGYSVYVENGYNIVASSNGSDPGKVDLLGAFCGRDGCTNTLTAVPNSSFSRQTLTLAKSDGGAFDLFSIDLTEFFSTSNTVTMRFTGTRADSSTVTTTKTLDGVFGVERFSFSGFSNLISVTFGGVTSDNILVDRISVRDSRKRIAIDPGHGQIQVGNMLQYQRLATATYGLYEDELTLDMANAAKEALEENYEVLMTRTGTRAPFAPANCGVPCKADLIRRRELAIRYGVDVFVSIHTNAGVEPDGITIDPFANGSEAFYRGADHNSLDLATRILNAVSALGTKRREVHQSKMAVLSQTMSNTLIETAFHTNSQLELPGQTITDEERLNSSAYRNQVGEAVANAVDEFIKAQSQP